MKNGNMKEINWEEDWEDDNSDGNILCISNYYQSYTTNIMFKKGEYYTIKKNIGESFSVTGNKCIVTWTIKHMIKYFDCTNLER